MSEQQALPYPMPQSKPGMLQAIAILCLADGILNIILGLMLVVSLLATIVCWPIGAYPIVVGILEIITPPSCCQSRQPCASRPNTWRSCRS
jgi:uncharacterized membrane protein HdeD (DUF308 family)